MAGPQGCPELRPKCNRKQQERQDGTCGEQEPSPLQGPMRVLPSHSSVFQHHAYLLSTYYVLGAGGHKDKHVLELGDLRLINRFFPHRVVRGPRKGSVKDAKEGPLTHPEDSGKVSWRNEIYTESRREALGGGTA